MTTDTFKMDCPKCGQNIECPFEGYDTLIDCPSCQSSILARPVAPIAPPPVATTKSKVRGNLIACHDCGESVSRNADSCPHCGKRMTSVFYYVFIGVVALIATVFILSIIAGMLTLAGASLF